MKKLAKLVAVATWSLFSTLYGYSIDTDRLGSDYRNFTTPYPQECAIACYTERTCRAYTHVRSRRICYLKNATPQESYMAGCTSGLSNVTFSELQQIVSAEGRNIRFKKNSACLTDRTVRAHRLKLIAMAVNKNSHAKLYISVKRKAGGLAKARVNYLNGLLSRLGLPPSKYHIQRVSRADRNRAWLSKNNQLWFRVGALR